MTQTILTELSKEEIEENSYFLQRHVGSGPAEIQEMLHLLGYSNIQEFIKKTVPEEILLDSELQLPLPLSEYETLKRLKSIVSQNKLFRSFIGAGYYNTILPPVIQRNILENPGWYTAYTPYQAEISQGRLEALLNFQTMICELTGMEISNASLLDEGTAAAEAMSMCFGLKKKENGNTIFVADNCHPQTIDVMLTRAEPFDIDLEISNLGSFKPSKKYFAILIQYPGTDGKVEDFEALSRSCKENGILFIVAADILSLALLKPPAEFGADVAIGSTQRFGVPMGFGGPHAAYMATHDTYKRSMPGRLIGVSKDRQGKKALRLALQTREQHIRRDKATSNICTAQVLLAVMAAMYASYHGPKGIKQIAESIHFKTRFLAGVLKENGYSLQHENFFDTLFFPVNGEKKELIRKRALEKEMNLNYLQKDYVGFSLDETVSDTDLQDLFYIFTGKNDLVVKIEKEYALPKELLRTSKYLQHEVFNSYHTETKMLRYLKMLENRDISLTRSMIPLGSCTMKLNAASEMLPLTWPELSNLHPFVPEEQSIGYRQMIEELNAWLSEITGFHSVSLQPNAGSQGEYAGLLAIRRYLQARGENERDICLIPISAHGTNPASAVMAGMKVVVVNCDAEGNIDPKDLDKKIEAHKENLAALMITYPSTHGVFEEGIRGICKKIHDAGGQVYMDGANMNAQVGLCKPADIGADVCHLNLHKTFCIPHGGEGPGVGPVALASHLVEYLPGHSLVSNGAGKEGAVSSAPYGSAGIVSISWAYIQMLGGKGLRYATIVAILNANYIAKRLSSKYPVLYKGKNSLVAHECIIDLRKFKNTAKVDVEDFAKRLIDYGFHAPTMSWPVPGTLMIEPTESESKEELDHFCDAMLTMSEEVKEIEEGKVPADNNPMKNAPHTAEVLLNEHWDFPYSREKAAFPLPYLRENKYWPVVGRVDNVYGDRNLVCTCPSIEDFR